MVSNLKQLGFCNTCRIETGDIYYIFCSILCRDSWIIVEEKQMGQFDIDKEVYIKWFQDKTIAIEALSREEIEDRIIKIREIEFWAKAEHGILHQQWYKISGKHGIPPGLKADREKLITDPNYKVEVNWDGEPRKKDKKPKEDKLKNLLDIDINELQAEARARKDAKSNGPAQKSKDKPMSTNDAITMLAEALSNPTPEVPKLSREEIEAKALAMKEKMRLAKEARENKG